MKAKQAKKLFPLGALMAFLFLFVVGSAVADVDGYNQTYDAGEASEVMIDITIETGASLVDYAPILGILLAIAIGAYLIGKARR